MARGVHLLGRVVYGLASLTIIGAWACEEPPLPMPPPDFGKMEVLGPSAETSAKKVIEEAAQKTEEQTIVSDGAVRLRWKIPEGEKARAFTAVFTGHQGSRPMRFDRQRRTRLSQATRRSFERSHNSGGKAVSKWIGLLRNKDAGYGSLAVDYVLGMRDLNRLKKDKRLAKMLKKLKGKPLISAEIAKNGAVISVDSPFDTDSISTGGHMDLSGIAIDYKHEGDLTLHTILLEMPAERVKVGDSWKVQMRHYTNLLFDQQKLDEKAQVKLLKLEQKADRVLATLVYKIRAKQTGRWLRLGRKPIPQTFLTTYTGRGVFNATDGHWQSFSGQYKQAGKGVMDFARVGKIKISPLAKVPKYLLKNL